MAKRISIITIGSELLDGRVLDTNANFACAELSKAGLAVAKIVTCDDKLEEIMATLNFVVENSDYVLLSGGLGPTSDDLTREAVANFAGVSLIDSAEALRDLEEFYKARKRNFDPSNLKQTKIPDGARVLRNLNGTAAGFLLKVKNGLSLAALPGVPTEFRTMFSSLVIPDILQKFKDTRKIHTACFRVFWMSESQIGSRLANSALPREITQSFRANFPEVQVMLKSETEISNSVSKAVEDSLGADNIYSRDLESDMPKVVHNLLLQKALSLSVAESCTGGLLGKLLSDNPGSSAYFLGGAITYSNELKIKLLGINSEDIEQHGAVSEVVAKAMALGASKHFHSDLALSITGIAGPEGGSEAKPVGTFYIGLATPDTLRAQSYFFHSSRRNIRRFAAFCALDLLRRNLLGLKSGGPHT